MNLFPYIAALDRAYASVYLRKVSDSSRSAVASKPPPEPDDQGVLASTSTKPRMPAGGAVAPVTDINHTVLV